MCLPVCLSLSLVFFVSLMHSLLLQIVTVFTLLIAFFSLNTSMYTNINEQTKEIGILRALGISRFPIFRIYGYEAFFVGLSNSQIDSVIRSMPHLTVGQIEDARGQFGFLVNQQATIVWIFEVSCLYSSWCYLFSLFYLLLAFFFFFPFFFFLIIHLFFQIFSFSKFLIFHPFSICFFNCYSFLFVSFFFFFQFFFFFSPFLLSINPCTQYINLF